MLRSRASLLRIFLLCFSTLGDSCVFVASGLESNSPREPILSTAVVTTDRLNVRSQPGVKYEIVCILEKGASVQIVKKKDEWCGILAPGHSEAWVAAEQLDGVRVKERYIPVYSGPGTMFSRFSSLTSGDTVSILSANDSKWVQIRPPKNAVVWVHSEYLEVDRSSLSSDVEGDEILDEKSRLVDRDIGNSPLNAEKTVGSESIVPVTISPVNQAYSILGDEKSITRNGTIIPLYGRRYPTNFGLGVGINSAFYPLIYLRGDEKELNKHKWNEVTLTGKQSWVRGWPRPLVIVESVEVRQARTDNQ